MTQYDATLSDEISSGVIETLPLMLTESGALGLNVQFSTPFGGKLSQGDMKDQDLTQYTVQSQSDWRGGRGQEVAYGPTNRFDSGLADTRFGNMAVLPPLPSTTGETTVTPNFMPLATTNKTSQKVEARRASSPVVVPEWRTDSGATVSDATTEVNATWTPGDSIGFIDVGFGQTLASKYAYSKWDSDGKPGFLDVSGSAQTIDFLTGDAGNQGVAFSFTPTKDVLVNSLSVLMRCVFKTNISQVYMHVGLYVDAGHFPGAGDQVISQGQMLVPAVSSTPTYVTFDSAMQLLAGQKYWFEMGGTNIGPCAVQIYGQTRVDPGSTIYGPSYGGSWTVMPNFTVNFKGDAGPGWTNHTTCALAQGFTIPVSGIVAQSMRVKTQLDLWMGSPTVTLEIRQGTQGGSVEATATLAQADFTTATAAYITKGISANLAAGTHYLVLTVASSDSANQANIRLWGDSLLGYPDGTSYRILNTNSMGWEASQTIDFFFSITVLVPGKRRGAQSFVTTGAVTLAKVQMYLARLSNAPIAGGTITIRTDVSGAPNPSAAVATRTVTQAELAAITTGAAWWSFTITGTLNATTLYWLCFEVDTGSSVSGKTVIKWYSDTSNLFTTGSAMVADWDTVGGTWGAWAAWPVAHDFFFRINDGTYQTILPLSKIGAAMSFVATAVTPTKIALLLQQVEKYGSGATLTVSLQTDSSGSPSGTLVHANYTKAVTLADLSSSESTWITVTFTAGSALSAGTTYWIVLEANSPDASPQPPDVLSISWFGDLNAPYAGVAKSRTYTNGSWGTYGATTPDLFFILNDGAGMTNNFTVNPVRFVTDWFAPNGAAVEKLNKTTLVWTAVATLGATITDMKSYAGKLYATLGDSSFVYSSSDGTTWAAETVKGTYLRPYEGYLYLGNAVLSTLTYFNGTTWATAYTVGNTDAPITGLMGFSSQIIITKTTGMWQTTGAASAMQIYDWAGQESANNGKGVLAWIGDGMLYVPIRNSLNAYNGAGMTPSGPDLDEGLGTKYQGRIAAMVGTPSWLIAAIDAGEGDATNPKYSSIMAHNSGGGWHTLIEADLPNQRIQTLGFEAITSSAGVPRLWYGQGKTMKYIELPDSTDNRFAYTASSYLSEGRIIHSWIGSHLSSIQKDFQSVIVRSTGCNLNQTVDVWLQVDRTTYPDGTPLFMKAGTVVRSPFQEIEFTAPAVLTKTCASGCTDTIIQTQAVDVLTDLFPGYFVRIGDEVSQVLSVDGASQFTLALPRKDGAPSAGDSVYTSRPSGYEARIKTVLKSTVTTISPRLLSVGLRYQEQIVDKARFSISFRVEDAMTDRTGAAYPYTAAQLRVLYRQWVRRLTPFYLVLADGTAYHVKAVNASEGQFTRQRSALGDNDFKSVATLQLVEI